MRFGARGSFFTTMTPSLKRCSRIAFLVFLEMRTMVATEKKKEVKQCDYEPGRAKCLET